MKTAGLLFCAIVGFVSLANVTNAGSDGAYPGPPLVQVKFDGLIPTFRPTFRVRFDGLQPTIRPLVHPGIAHIPITQNLVQTGDQPLLLTN